MASQKMNHQGASVGAFREAGGKLGERGWWFVRKQRRRKLEDQRPRLSHVTWILTMRPEKWSLLRQLSTFSCQPSEFRMELGLSFSLDNCPQAGICQHLAQLLCVRVGLLVQCLDTSTRPPPPGGQGVCCAHHYHSSPAPGTMPGTK